MSQPPANDTELKFTLEEFAAEVNLRPSFVKHLLAKDAFPVRTIGGLYHITAGELVEIKEAQQRGREELADAFANADENRRKIIARAAGVSLETAAKFGY